VSYKSVKAKFVVVWLSQLAMTEVNWFLVLVEAIEAQ